MIHLRNKKGKKDYNGIKTNLVDTSSSSRLNPKLSGIVLRILLLDYSLGCMRNWLIGRIHILGKVMKVIPSSWRPTHYQRSFLKNLRFLVLTWISIYWFSRAGPAASVRIYCEHNRTNMSIFTTNPPTNVLKGISYFPKEILGFRRKCEVYIYSTWNGVTDDLSYRWLKSSNLVFEAKHDGGGHFAAYEKPDELVADLRKMFGKGSRAFGIVPGKTGFL